MTEIKFFRNPFCNSRHGNEPCFCASGKKMKKCHGREYKITEEEKNNYMEAFQAWEDGPAGIEYYKKMQGGKK